MASLHREKYLKIGLWNCILILFSLVMCSARLINTKESLLSSRQDLPVSTEPIPISVQTSSKPLTNRGAIKFLTTVTTAQPIIEPKSEDHLNDNQRNDLYKISNNENNESSSDLNVFENEGKASSRQPKYRGTKPSLTRNVERANSSTTSQPNLHSSRSQNPSEIGSTSIETSTNRSRHRQVSPQYSTESSDLVPTAAVTTNRGSYFYNTQTSNSTELHSTTDETLNTKNIFQRNKKSTPSTIGSTVSTNEEPQALHEAINEYTVESTDTILLTSTSTESYHFDLSKFTSDFHLDNIYSVPEKSHPTTRQAIDNQQSTRQHTSERQIDSSKSPSLTIDFGEYRSQVQDFEQTFQNIKLTTPSTASFDTIHQKYQITSDYEEANDTKEPIYTSFVSPKYNDQVSSNLNQQDPNSNSTNERNSTHFVDVAEVESSSYSISTNDVRGEDKEANLTLPSSSEVWALAAMKKQDYVKEQRGKALNTTSSKDDLENNTVVTKQIADWATVMQDEMYANHSLTNTTISNRGSIKHQKVNTDSTGEENQVVLAQTVLPPPGFAVPSETLDIEFADRVSSADKSHTMKPTVIIDNSTEKSTSKAEENNQTIEKPLNTNYIETSAVSDIDDMVKLEVTKKPGTSHIISSKLSTHLPTYSKPTPEKSKESENTYNLVKENSTEINILEEENNINKTLAPKTTVRNSEYQSSSSPSISTQITESITLNSDINNVRSSDKVDPANMTLHSNTSESKIDDDFIESNLINNKLFTKPTVESKLSSTTVNINLEITLSPSVNYINSDLTTQKPLLEGYTSTSNIKKTTNSLLNETALPTSYVNIIPESTLSPSVNYNNSGLTAIKSLLEGPTFTSKILRTTNSLLIETVLPTSTKPTFKPTISSPTTSTTSIYELDDELEYTTLSNNDDDDDIEEIDIQLTSTEIHKLTTNIIESKIHTTESVQKQTSRKPTDSILIVLPSTSAENLDHRNTTLLQIRHQSKNIIVNTNHPSDINAVIAATASAVGIICLVLLVGFLHIMRTRQKSRRANCHPAGRDAFSLEHVPSILGGGSIRKSMKPKSKLAYGNPAFDDPDLIKHPLTLDALVTFVSDKTAIHNEFKELPQITASIADVPVGCEEKNRYVNVVPLNETRVYLKRIGDDGTTEYINANHVRGPKDTANYYIATQAPLENTVADFWRMIWEQKSRVIIMATDLNENGLERCVEYLPPSVVLDNVLTFDKLQLTLKCREVKTKYAVSTLELLNTVTGQWRVITHFWYQWPIGKSDSLVPETASVVAMLLEAQSCLNPTHCDRTEDCKDTVNETNNEQLKLVINTEDSESFLRSQGPLTVHCATGTGRTGTLIACDIALRELEQPTSLIDIPRIVYFVRNGRANAVATREQYEFIYGVAHFYATKLVTPSSPE